MGKRVEKEVCIPMSEIIIFGKSTWPYTEKARSAYGEDATYVDVVREPDKLKEMLQFSKGVRKVPVIVEGEKVEIGYGGTWGVWLLIGDELKIFDCRF